MVIRNVDGNKMSIAGFILADKVLGERVYEHQIVEADMKYDGMPGFDSMWSLQTKCYMGDELHYHSMWLWEYPWRVQVKIMQLEGKLKIGFRI